MGFYYLTEKRKFDTEWEKLRAEYEAAGMDRKEAMKQVAKDRGLKKRDIYQLLLENKEDSRD